MTTGHQHTSYHTFVQCSRWKSSSVCLSGGGLSNIVAVSWPAIWCLWWLETPWRSCDATVFFYIWVCLSWVGVGWLAMYIRCLTCIYVCLCINNHMSSKEQGVITYSQVPNRRARQNIRSGWHISSKWYKGRAVYKVRVTRCSASPNIRSGLQIVFDLILLQKQEFSIKIGLLHAVCE